MNMKDVYRRRLRARELNIRRRFTSLTAKEQVYIGKFSSIRVNLMIVARDIEGDEEKKERCLALGKVYYAEALKLG